MKKTTVISYLQDIANKLKDAKRYGGVSLMVGAGFSKNADSIGELNSPPNWSELAGIMYEELYPKPKEEQELNSWEINKQTKSFGKNVIHLAEEYIAFFGRNKMNQLIEDSIADDNFRPGKLHKKLLEFDWKDIFTTNYDTLLEQTSTNINTKQYKVVLSQDNISGTGGAPRIVKLHGSIPGIRPYIISEEDYRQYPKKYAIMVNTVQQAMIETTLCMIGFSGDDPNFLSWHGWLRDNLGKNCPIVYLIGIFDDMNEAERKLSQNRGIALVDLGELLIQSF